MTLLDDIRKQNRLVRQTMYALSVATVLSVIGFFWFTSVERQLYMAVNPNPKDQQEFLTRQDQRSPQFLATLGRGLGSLTASIGSLLGFDRSRGFDKGGTAGHTQDAVYLLPLSK